MRDNGVAGWLAAMRELPDRSVGACYRAAVAAEVSGDRTRALAWLEDAMNRGYAPRNRECVLVASFELARKQRRSWRHCTGVRSPVTAAWTERQNTRVRIGRRIAMVVVYS